MLRKSWPWIAALLFGGAILLLAEQAFLPSFRECEDRYTASQGDAPSSQKADAVLNMRAKAICTIRLVDRHNGLLAALGGLAVAAFTGVLWGSTEKLWKLGRQEFEASHRPWLSVRDAQLVKRAHLTAESIELSVIFTLENVGEVPALDIALSGVLCPAADDAKVLAVRDEAIRSYEADFGNRRRPQNQVLFPGDKPLKYAADLPLPHGPANVSADALAHLLVVAAFIYESAVGGRRTFFHTSAVFWIDLPIDEETLTSAKAGTDHLLNGQIGRYSIGWDAT